MKNTQCTLSEAARRLTEIERLSPTIVSSPSGETWIGMKARLDGGFVEYEEVRRIVAWIESEIRPQNQS